MRMLIHFDKQGQIISVAQAESLDEGLEHPFVLDAKGEGVLELAADNPLADLPGHAIFDDYVVNIKRKTLVKKPQRDA